MIQKAVLKDVKQIHRLVNSFAAEKLMLPRSLNYVYSNIRDFWVNKERNKITGCCSLEIVGWQQLAEIKSLAVDKRYQKQGIGEKLVRECFKEAEPLGVKRIFVLTYKPGYFKKLGFRLINKNKLPQKIWKDCIDCPEFPDCKEVSMIRKI